MKKIFMFIVAFFLFFTLTGYSLASDQSRVASASNPSVIVPDSSIQKNTATPNDDLQDVNKSDLNHDATDLARRGCCSHHGGVCGCDENTNRIVCCDGTLSPSCTCSGY